MKIAITGANGFVARQLIATLKERLPISQISLIDLKFASDQKDSSFCYYEGDLADHHFLNEIFSQTFDLVYHLASMPGASAEQDSERAAQVNFLSTHHLILLLQKYSPQAKLIYASSIAVYGHTSKNLIHEADHLYPNSSYATHKAISELLISDAVRRGDIQGCSVRLPGIVARKYGLKGFSSAFMSEIFWHLKNNQLLNLPVSLDSTAWWLSVETTAQNLYFAGLELALNSQNSIYQLPVLRHSVQEVIDGISNYLGESKSHLINVSIDPYIQKNFGSLPELDAHWSIQQGFYHDGNLENLIQHVFEKTL